MDVCASEFPQALRFHLISAFVYSMPQRMNLRRWQVFDCKTMQLLQRYSLPGTAADIYECVAALPAGRIAAGNSAGIDVLDLSLDTDSCAAQTVLSTADASARYAACLGKADKDLALCWACTRPDYSCL